jgi:hypothetical protein
MKLLLISIVATLITFHSVGKFEKNTQHFCNNQPERERGRGKERERERKKERKRERKR